MGSSETGVAAVLLRLLDIQPENIACTRGTALGLVLASVEVLCVLFAAAVGGTCVGLVSSRIPKESPIVSLLRPLATVTSVSASLLMEKLLFKPRLNVKLPSSISGFAALVCLLKGFGFVLQLALQWLSGHWLMSAATLSVDGRLSPFRVAEVILVVPIAEEVIFRGVLLRILRLRCAPKSLAPLIVTSVIFAVAHLANHHAYSYRIFQLCMALSNGMLFAARAEATGLLHDSIAIHIVTNAVAAFFQPSVSITSDPHLLGSATVSLVGTLALAMWDVTALRRRIARA